MHAHKNTYTCNYAHTHTLTQIYAQTCKYTQTHGQGTKTNIHTHKPQPADMVVNVMRVNSHHTCHTGPQTNEQTHTYITDTNTMRRTCAHECVYNTVQHADTPHTGGPLQGTATDRGTPAGDPPYRGTPAGDGHGQGHHFALRRC